MRIAQPSGSSPQGPTAARSPGGAGRDPKISGKLAESSPDSRPGAIFWSIEPDRRLWCSTRLPAKPPVFAPPKSASPPKPGFFPKGVRPGLGILGALLALLARPAAAVDVKLPSAFEVTDKFLQGRQRIGARPGDLALRNRAATAIVRKADGWLVDFWPNDPLPSTAPQLKGMTNLDGLWQLHSLLIDG